MKYHGKTKYNYYDNSVTCGNCNGMGCRQCLFNGIPELRGYGNERFPLSRTINGCKPPYIQNTYAWNLNPLSRLYILTTSQLRSDLNITTDDVVSLSRDEVVYEMKSNLYRKR
jgi:hypothetical protein